MKEPDTLQKLQTGQLIGTQRVNLSCQLTELPSELYDLADSLEILDLSGNRLTTLPDDIGRLKNLRIIFLNQNCFETFPAVLSQCPNLYMISVKSNAIREIPEQSFPKSLRWLTVTDNQLEQLPATIGHCSNLQKLLLAGNQLTSLPDALSQCENLELLRIAANRLDRFPDWLLTMPRLSWLAYSGNPFCSQTNRHFTIPDIAWQTLELGEMLGQGASGVIFKGLWQENTLAARPVAVKIFKGEVTSDGFPEDEMNACIAAAGHPHLVPVLGRVTHHPEQRQGLVLEFLPDSYHTLGAPPSLESCTRDIYENQVTFSLQQMLAIALGIASAATHLHQRGILHGDLYPHNTLVNAEGHSLLSDFGAASFYGDWESDRSEHRGRSLQQLEVRAFGCLLEDLLLRWDQDGNGAIAQELHTLKQACFQPQVNQRPLFADILAQLTMLQTAA